MESSVLERPVGVSDEDWEAGRDTPDGNVLPVHPEGIGDDGEEAAPAEFTLVGLPNEQLSFSVGGKKPTTSTFRLNGRSVTIPGNLKKGEQVTLQIRVRIGGVHFDDKVDPSTDQVIDCTRKQIGRIIGNVLLVPDE